MMTPFRWVTGGGDQENSTSLSPATAENICGDPDGTERRQTILTLFQLEDLLKARNCEEYLLVLCDIKMCC